MQYPCAKTTMNYIIPEGVIHITEESIYNCNNLISITIPSTI